MKTSNKGAEPFWTIMFAIFFGNFMSTLATTTINVALPVFMEDFSASLTTVQWMMSGFMLATGVIAPIVGFLGDKFSYKRLYIGALIGFTLFSGLCTLAWNIQSLIVFRIIQGLASGIIMPTTLTLIYQTIAKEKQPAAVSLWSVSAMLAPALGPTVGGILTDKFGWESVFLLNMPVGLIAIAVAMKYIPFLQLKQPKQLDVVSFGAVIGGTSLLLVGFSEANHWGWSSWQTLTVFTLSAAILLFFVIRSLRVGNPLLNLRVLAIPRFTYSLIINCVITISLYAVTLLIPIYMQNIQHSTTFHTGLVMLPGTLAMIAFSSVTGKLYAKLGPARLIFAGGLIITFATWELSRMNMTTSIAFVTIWLMIRYAGIGLCNSPVTNSAMSAVSKEESGQASGVMNWIRQGLAAMSVSIFSSILASRSAAHQASLPPSAAQPRELSQALAIQDVFVIGTVIILLVLPLVLLIRRPRTRATSASGRAV